MNHPVHFFEGQTHLHLQVRAKFRLGPSLVLAFGRVFITVMSPTSAELQQIQVQHVGLMGS